jgi:hypothetical protein
VVKQMSEELVKRLFMLAIVQADIDGMKVVNDMEPREHKPYGQGCFAEKADTLRNVVNCPDHMIMDMEV